MPAAADPTGMFVLIINIGTAIAICFLTYILNGLRRSVESVAKDLKLLNDTVLAQYVTRAEHRTDWEGARRRMHELGNQVFGLTTAVEVFRNTGKMPEVKVTQSNEPFRG